MTAEGWTEWNAHRPERLRDIDEHHARGDEVHDPPEKHDHSKRQQSAKERVFNVPDNVEIIVLRMADEQRRRR